MRAYRRPKKNSKQKGTWCHFPPAFLSIHFSMNQSVTWRKALSWSDCVGGYYWGASLSLTVVSYALSSTQCFSNRIPGTVSFISKRIYLAPCSRGHNIQGGFGPAGGCGPSFLGRRATGRSESCTAREGWMHYFNPPSHEMINPRLHEGHKSIQ